MKTLITALSVLVLASAAQAQIRITEWMYSPDGSNGEFIEFTNVGNAPIDMTGWSYDDDSATPGVLPLSAFGVVQPGESVIITEVTAASFRAEWNLPASVQVIGGYTNNLGRNDQINLFNDMSVLVDRLTYGDQTFPGTIRTQGISGNPISDAALGANDPSQWVLSFVGDSFGSYASFGGDVANPGSYIPAPGAAVLGVMGLVFMRRRRA